VSNNLFCAFRLITATIILVSLSPSLSADPFLTWNASSDLTPDQLDPPYELTLSDGAGAPALESGFLRISTTQNGQNAFYLMREPLVNTTQPFTLEFSVQLVSGSSSVNYRGPVMVFITTSPGTGTLLAIDVDKIFFLTGNFTPGPVAEVDTDGAPHDYRLEHDGSGGFKLYYDDGEILTTSTFNDVNSHGSQMRVAWGEASTNASGESKWVYFRHTALDESFSDSFEASE